MQRETRTRWRGATALGLAVIAVMGASTDAAAKCALRSLGDEVATNAADEIPAGGGVLVGWVETDDHGGPRDVDPVVHPTWAFREKRKKVRATMTAIAPGLAVYVPAVGRGQKHTVALVDGARTVGTYKFAKVTAAGQAAAALILPPPKVTLVQRSETQSFRSHDIALMVTLEKRDHAIPPDAYGIILYRGDTALSWHRIDKPDEIAVPAYDSPGRCGAEPPAMTPAAAGDMVTLAWVDRFGRVSARSAPIQVK
ncbi:MAG: hypothetical protein K8W52_23665 [Deltaproteobacteria bacterium]|nr:hypothetical protein [Deltaproteobacteria bacterium]